MTVDSIDVVFYTCIFLFPGYIIQEIINALMPSQQYTDGIKLLRFMGFSVLNLAIWSWLYKIVISSFTPNEVLYWIMLSAVTFATSSITGFAVGISRNKGWLRSALSRFNIQIEHPIPTAWDYKFSKINDTRWVIVSLSNGEVIYGKYSAHSFASSDNNYRDLYIEEVYSYDEGKPWNRINGTDGILINASEIKSVEFKK